MNTDYVKIYYNSDESKTINMFDFGMLELKTIINYRKKNLISKSEYNKSRNEIEKQLLRL